MNKTHPGISRADYEALPGINISLLVKALRSDDMISMAKLKWAMRNPEEMTDALRLGIALHTEVFEKALYRKRIVVAPKFKGTGSVAARADFKEQHKDKLIISEDEDLLVSEMALSINFHPLICQLLKSPGCGELGAQWEVAANPHATEQIQCKGMLDRYCGEFEGYTWILDLKSTRNIEGFARAVKTLHYHVKAAWYLDGLNAIQEHPRRFLWLVVEKTPPYDCRVFEPDDECLAEGRRVCRALLGAYYRAKSTDNWPGYSPGIEPLVLPSWGFTKPEVDFSE